MRTTARIRQEIAALKALRLRVCGAKKRRVTLAVKVLDKGFDLTADELHELPEAEQDIILSTAAWKEGDINMRPSVGWGAESRRPPKSAAILTVHHFNDMSPQGRRDISRWLFRQARFIISPTAAKTGLANRFTARYLYALKNLPSAP